MNSFSAATTSSQADRSSRPSCTRKLASASYSIWPRSGALPAASWLKKLLYVPPLPLGPVCTLTWMSGFSSFHIATTSSMPGIHDVKSSVTLPSDGAQDAASAVLPPSPPDPPEHPASASALSSATPVTTALFLCCISIPYSMGCGAGFTGRMPRARPRSGGSFHRSAAQSVAPEALEQEECGDERHDRQERADEDVGTQLGDLVELRVPRVEAERHGEQLFAAQHDQRQEEVVPDRDELEEEDRDERGHHEAHRDREERAHLARTVDAARFDELVGDGCRGIDPAEVDAEGAHDAREQHRPERVRQVHLAEQEEERECERRGGHEHAAEHDVEVRLSSAEPVLREGVAAHAREDRGEEGPEPRVRDAVADPADVDPAAVVQQIADVREEVAVREPQRVRREQVAAILRGGDEQPPDRHEEVEREDAHDQQRRSAREEALTRTTRRCEIGGGARGAGEEAHCSAFRWVILRNVNDRTK